MLGRAEGQDETRRRPCRVPTHITEKWWPGREQPRAAGVGIDGPGALRRCCPRSTGDGRQGGVARGIVPTIAAYVKETGRTWRARSGFRGLQGFRQPARRPAAVPDAVGTGKGSARDHAGLGRERDLHRAKPLGPPEAVTPQVRTVSAGGWPRSRGGGKEAYVGAVIKVRLKPGKELAAADTHHAGREPARLGPGRERESSYAGPEGPARPTSWPCSRKREKARAREQIRAARRTGKPCGRRWQTLSPARRKINRS